MVRFSLPNLRSPDLSANNGQSLVEIMIALGLLGFLSLAVAELSSKSAISQRTVSSADTFDDIVGTANLLLMRDATCSQFLHGKVFVPTLTSGSSVATAGSPLVLPNGNETLIQDGFITADRKIQFQAAGSALLIPVAALPTQTVTYNAGISTTVNVTLANLVVTANRLGPRLGAQTLKGSVTNIAIATDPVSNVIQYCAGVTNSSTYDVCLTQPSAPNTPVACPTGFGPSPKPTMIECLSSSVCP